LIRLLHLILLILIIKRIILFKEVGQNLIQGFFQKALQESLHYKNNPKILEILLMATKFGLKEYCKNLINIRSSIGLQIIPTVGLLLKGKLRRQL
jgi:hypothetical protein